MFFNFLQFISSKKFSWYKVAQTEQVVPGEVPVESPPQEYSEVPLPEVEVPPKDWDDLTLFRNLAKESPRGAYAWVWPKILNEEIDINDPSNFEILDFLLQESYKNKNEGKTTDSIAKLRRLVEIIDINVYPNIFRDIFAFIFDNITYDRIYDAVLDSFKYLVKEGYFDKLQHVDFNLYKSILDNFTETSEGYSNFTSGLINRNTPIEIMGPMIEEKLDIMSSFSISSAKNNENAKNITNHILSNNIIGPQNHPDLFDKVCNSIIDLSSPINSYNLLLGIKLLNIDPDEKEKGQVINIISPEETPDLFKKAIEKVVESFEDTPYNSFLLLESLFYNNTRSYTLDGVQRKKEGLWGEMFDVVANKAIQSSFTAGNALVKNFITEEDGDLFYKALSSVKESPSSCEKLISEGTITPKHGQVYFDLLWVSISDVDGLYRLLRSLSQSISFDPTIKGELNSSYPEVLPILAKHILDNFDNYGAFPLSDLMLKKIITRENYPDLFYGLRDRCLAEDSLNPNESPDSVSNLGLKGDLLKSFMTRGIISKEDGDFFWKTLEDIQKQNLHDSAIIRDEGAVFSYHMLQSKGIVPEDGEEFLKLVRTCKESSMANHFIQKLLTIAVGGEKATNPKNAPVNRETGDIFWELVDFLEKSDSERAISPLFTLLEYRQIVPEDGQKFNDVASKVISGIPEVNDFSDLLQSQPNPLKILMPDTDEEEQTQPIIKEETHPEIYWEAMYRLLSFDQENYEMGRKEFGYISDNIDESAIERIKQDPSRQQLVERIVNRLVEYPKDPKSTLPQFLDAVDWKIDKRQKRKYLSNNLEEFIIDYGLQLPAGHPNRFKSETSEKAAEYYKKLKGSLGKALWPWLNARVFENHESMHDALYYLMPTAAIQLLTTEGREIVPKSSDLKQ